MFALATKISKTTLHQPRMLPYFICFEILDINCIYENINTNVNRHIKIHFFEEVKLSYQNP